MKKLLKIGLIVLAILSCMLFVTAVGTTTVFNPFTGKLDYVSNGNFSGSNLTVDSLEVNGNLTLTSKNITLVECIHFVSGGKICTG